MSVEFPGSHTAQLISVLALWLQRLLARVPLYDAPRQPFFIPGLTPGRGGNKKSNEETIKPGVVISGEIMHGCLNRVKNWHFTLLRVV